MTNKIVTSEDLTKLAKQVELDYNDWKDASRKEGEARKTTTTCLNSLNHAQRNFDDALKTFKKQGGGDWNTKTGESCE